LTRRIQPDPIDSLPAGITISRPATGINMSRWFISNIRYNMKRVANTNPSITQGSARVHPVPLQSAPRDCKRGLGAGPKATTVNASWWSFNNYCGGDPNLLNGRNMADFVDAIWAHEGFGRGVGTGHESLARAEAGKPANDPYKGIEGFNDPDSASLAQRVRNTVGPMSDAINLASSDSTQNGPKGNLSASGYLWYWDVNQNNILGWHGYQWLGKGF
jgi:hypothetical protein